MYPHDAATLESLLSHADMAMYAAKHHDKGPCEFYQTSL
jgi:predicted signal transduction protein with EAL and GGDEF domain